MIAIIGGIACNTAHAPLIFDRIREVLKENNCRINLVNAIEEMVSFTKEVINRLQTAIDYYRDMKAGAIILGCSEIALVIEKLDYSGLRVIKPMTILAKALIKGRNKRD